MIDVESIILEDNKEYIIVSIAEVNNNKYLYLISENDETDICIRKIIKENDKELIVPLDNKEEVDKALSLFQKQNN